MRHPIQSVTMVLIQQMQLQHAIHLDTAVAHTPRRLDMDGLQPIFQFLWMI